MVHPTEQVLLTQLESIANSLHAGQLTAEQADAEAKRVLEEHQDQAAKRFVEEMEDARKAQRRRAAIVFGLIVTGMGAAGILGSILR